MILPTTAPVAAPATNASSWGVHPVLNNIVEEIAAIRVSFFVMVFISTPFFLL
jgi:hypothetical protein